METKTDWLRHTREAIDKLSGSPTASDAEGSPVQPAAAVHLLEFLSMVLNHDTPPPSVVPTWEGGVQVEWHRNGVDFEIEAGPSGNIDFFFKDADIECEGQAQDSIQALRRYAKALV